MINDLRLHGTIGNIEYFAFIGGPEIYSNYFYEENKNSIRFFSRGNEFTITETGVYYNGTGGSFCEYMFGVEKPIKDLIKKSVVNRLIMFGAFLDKNEKVVFTNNTEGKDSFYRLFLHGHAVKNYYFFVSSDIQGDYIRRQKLILRSVGKFLKRTNLISEDKDTELLNGFISELKEKNSTVFIFKLVNIGNEKFYSGLKKFYSRERMLSLNEELYLEDIVARYEIDRYQLERMRIDIMYRHPENKSVVDEYRDILLSGMQRETLQKSEIARLNRLRTLGIRNNIPEVLFETLDELLLKGKKVQQTEEPEYLLETRMILQSLFFKDPALKKHIINEDIVRLIKAKKAAELKGDKGFEQVLLDTVRTCDEIVRETNDFSYFEEFTSVVTYFDRYDNTSSLLSKIAFLENIDLTEDSLRSLIGNKKEFDQLDPKLFEEVFIQTLLNNKYISAYGKKKIQTINRGIKKISAGDASLKEVIAELRSISEEEKLYKMVYAALKERLRSFFPGLDTRKGREKVREDIIRELSEKDIRIDVPKKLFEKVFIDLQKESFYINHLLPIIIQNKDINLREDFLENSGLDRFYVETLEKDYFEQKGLDSSILEQLVVGGGERI